MAPADTWEAMLGDYAKPSRVFGPIINIVWDCTATYIYLLVVYSLPNIL